MKKYIVALLLTCFAAPVFAVSFDCTKFNTGVYKIICESPELSALDDDLQKRYDDFIEKHGSSKEFKDFIRASLRERGECRSEECVLNWYYHNFVIYDQLEEVIANEKSTNGSIKLTDDTLREYCGYVADLVVSAYIDAASTPYTPVPLLVVTDRSVSAAKSKLLIDSKRYKQLVAKALDDRGIIYSMRTDAYAAQTQAQSEMRIRCEADPEGYIPNYRLIFKQ